MFQCTGVAFWLAQYSTTSSQANANTCPIPVHPLDCAVHAKYVLFNPIGAHTRVIRLCMPLTYTEKWRLIKLLHRLTTRIHIQR